LAISKKSIPGIRILHMKEACQFEEEEYSGNDYTEIFIF
jgi:hypothetical protein